ncbi:PTR2-domain-containing protein [Peniophora sp. CONT]|nr:PTR2-domain-containing protein [Peniophora sp. CONT]
MEKGPNDAFYAGIARAQNKDVALDVERVPTLNSATSADKEVLPDGLIAPTEEELETLRHIAGHVNWSTYLIAFVEMAERFSYYGSTIVLVNFIQQPRPHNSSTGAGGPDGQSGALGKGQRTSTGLTTLLQFWAYITPLFGAYIADTYWGRFKTIAVSVAIALVGHIVLIISAIPPVLAHPNGALGALIVAILIMGLGTGGFKSNISPLIAEQQRSLKPYVMTKSNGERVIVDPVLTTSRVYMYFYFFINVGSLIGQVTMVFAEKYVGFYLSFLLPTIIYLCCPLVLFIGRNRYRHTPPTGSVLGTALRLWKLASRGRWSANPIKTIKLLKAPDFWESAKPSNISIQHRPSWMTFDDAWVDEVRRGLKACTVFLFYPLYWLAYNQMVNNLTSQAATMELHGAPNDVINNLDPLALILFIPVFDAFLYPSIRRMGINFSPLRRITAGFLIGSAAMIWAAVTQHYIYKMSPCGSSAGTCLQPAPINVWSQTGAYVLIAASEIFASITGLEYAFTKAPANMKSLVMAMFLFMQALAAALGEAFTSLSTDPVRFTHVLLVWNYSVMAALAGIGGIFFWVSFHNLDAEEKMLNELPEAHYIVKETTRDSFE